jgi:hypothetical protein
MTMHSNVSYAIDDNYPIVPADPEPKNEAVTQALYNTTQHNGGSRAYLNWRVCAMHSIASTRTRARSGLSPSALTECIALLLSADLP